MCTCPFFAIYAWQVPPGQEVELKAGKIYIIEVEDMATTQKKRRFLYSSVRKRKISSSDYNSGLIKVRRGRIGDTPGSFPTKVVKKTIYGMPYMLYDTSSLSASDFALLMEGPKVK